MASEPDQTQRHRIRRRAFLAGGIALVPLAAFGGYEAWSVTNGLGRLNRTLDLPGGSPSSGHSGAPSTPDPDKGHPVNILMIGSDSRDKVSGDGRSDTIMVLHLDADRKNAYLISFPRDMWVDIPGHGKNKINAAYSFGGPQLSVATLEQLTGVRMDHVAQVNFEGFISLTNTLGGVTINNTHAFSSHGYNYPKGEITIQGPKALWFVRERHSLPNGDLDRAANQRKVVQAIMAKGLSGGTISNPLKFNSFVSGIAEDVTVDNSLTNSEIRKIALSLRMSPANIKQIQAPIAGFNTVPGVGDVDVVDQPKMKELAKDLKQDDLGAYVKKYPRN